MRRLSAGSFFSGSSLDSAAPYRPARFRAGATLLALCLASLLGAACDHRVPRDQAEWPRDLLEDHSYPLQSPGADEPRDPTLAQPAPAAWLPDDGNWYMPLKDYAGTRYSQLTEINTTNVRSLQLVWSQKTGYARGHEATPIVVNNMMYIVMPFPNRLYAWDISNPRQPRLAWVYEPPETQLAAQGVACCDHVNRGAVYANGRLFYATLDNQAIAVDAQTGEAVWVNRIGNIHIGETMTMSPIVVRDKVFFGNAGAEFGVRGWLKALDINTGELLWTAWSTGSDADVLIGENFRPFYEADRGEELGVTSWPPEQWRIGGGTVWGWLNYDPELDLLYYGTANAAPWNPEVRPGKNKWAGTVFARRPDTGEAIWAYQWDPYNAYDWDGVNENTLLDMPVNGEMRRVLVRAERNGYMYVIDRATGEVLHADPYMHSTVVKGVDLRTGQPIVDLSKMPGFGRTVHGICPAVPGAKDWEPTAFSPRTGYLYVPGNNFCNDMEGAEANFIAGTPYMGVTNKMYAGPGGNLGEFFAWDVVNRRKVWSIEEKFLTWSGPLVTAGDLVFYGTMDRWFKAVDARTGQVLWQFEAETGFIAPPMTFRGADGRQYIAITSGPGGWAGSVVSVPLDPRDATADKGIVNAMRELPQYTGRGGYIYIFGLP
jgi:lanthanide-dependent methanol dehydrogenase